MKRRPAEHSYRNQSAAPAPPAGKPTFEPVIIPQPVFRSPGEKRALEGAVLATERRPGEELHEWIERVARVAEAAGR